MAATPSPSLFPPPRAANGPEELLRVPYDTLMDGVWALTSLILQKKLCSDLVKKRKKSKSRKAKPSQAL